MFSKYKAIQESIKSFKVRSLKSVFSKHKTAQNKQATLWVSFGLLAFLVFFELYALEIDYLEYVASFYNTQGTLALLPIIFYIAASFYLSFLFIQFALTANWFCKTICFALFFIAAFIEFSYRMALGRFLETLDIGVAIITTTTQKIALILMHLNLYAIVPCLAFLICLIMVKKPAQKRSLKKLILGFTIFILSFIGLSFVEHTFAKEQIPTLSLSAFFRLNADFIIWKPITSHLAGTVEVERRAVKKPDLGENFKPINNVVLILDESVRGDHFSLNGYRRKTTPFLEKLAGQGVLQNWGISSSAATGSSYTYNALITGAKPTDFPDLGTTRFRPELFMSPTLYQYAQAMGYKTYFFNGQLETLWGGESGRYIDKHFSVSKFNNNRSSPDWEIDKQIAKQISKIISVSTGNFILVFKHGSHIPYQENFPPNQQTWKPSYTSGEIVYGTPDEDKIIQKIINTYDNSIKYNVDSFFENLVDDYSNIPNNTVFLYTSDHGQTLFEGGINTSHGGASKAEAMVPLFVIGKFEKKFDTRYKASHQNILPTLLDLMKYPKELRETDLALSLLEAKAADSKPRFFNPELREKVPFD